MKMTKFLAAIALLTSTMGYSSWYCGLEWSPEIKAGYFFPTSSDFRDIYCGTGMYSFELTTSGWGCLRPFASVGYAYTSGKSNLGTHTNVTLVPINAGLKAMTCWGCTEPYIGLGVEGMYLKTKDKSSFVEQQRSNWGVGGVAKAGFWTCLPCDWFLDAFVDFHFAWIDFKNGTPLTIGLNANVSGLAFGLGIGKSF